MVRPCYFHCTKALMPSAVSTHTPTPQGSKTRILKKLANRPSSTVESSHDPATVASAPPKRSKAAHIPVKTRRVQPIDRDEDGNPKLPQQIGVLTVLSLGHIVTDRPTFHNERYIFPVGYTVSR